MQEPASTGAPATRDVPASAPSNVDSHGAYHGPGRRRGPLPKRETLHVASWRCIILRPRSHPLAVVRRRDRLRLSGGRRFVISSAELSALLQVILVDLVLAGDNAIVVGMVAASLPLAMRPRIIFIGIMAATVMRVLFALITVQLLQIVGLVLAGGLLLLWVCWKLWREILAQRRESKPILEPGLTPPPEKPKSLREAVVQIVIADVSMSLDNVLAVAGIARDHTWVLVVGLVLSIAFMGLAATVIARLLNRHHWIAYIGLAVILYVAITMIVEGAQDLGDAALAHL